MRLLPLIMLLFLSVPVCSQPSMLGRVVQVIDGESFTVQNKNSSKTTIRLAGIDAPEKDQVFSSEAIGNLELFLLNKDVSIVTYKIDSKSRLVAKVLLDEADVALHQIRGGFAWHAKNELGEDTKADRELYAAAEVEARRNKRGLWNGDR